MYRTLECTARYLDQTEVRTLLVAVATDEDSTEQALDDDRVFFVFDSEDELVPHADHEIEFLSFDRSTMAEVA